LFYVGLKTSFKLRTKFEMQLLDRGRILFKISSRCLVLVFVYMQVKIGIKIHSMMTCSCSCSCVPWVI